MELSTNTSIKNTFINSDTNYENTIINGRRLLWEKVKNIEHDYKNYLKLSIKNHYWLLYVELSDSHPYLTNYSGNTWVDKSFLVEKNRRTKKNNPNLARCIYVKFNYDMGTLDDAMEHLEMFSKSLKKLEIESIQINTNS